MFIEPKTHWNIKKNYYSNGNQFKRKICKGSLEILLFMQITNFLTDFCCTLAFLDVNILRSHLPRKLNVHKECFAILKDLSAEKRKC